MRNAKIIFMNKNPIGIFDSGIGGLTVTREVINALPYESIVYLGDTARIPYGTRSKEVITKFALELVNFLLKKGVKVLVVACNTISANSLEEIKKVSPVPVIGVIKPAIKAAIETTKNNKIGVIGTPGTINSKSYETGIKNADSSMEVVSVAAPLFVPIAEEGFSEHIATAMIAQEYLKEIKSSGVDTLILGCTHYPLLDDVIQKTVGDSITLVDSAKPTAEELKKILEDNDLLTDEKNPEYKFFVTDAPERVYKVASTFFGDELDDSIEKVTLENE